MAKCYKKKQPLPNVCKKKKDLLISAKTELNLLKTWHTEIIETSWKTIKS